MNKIFKVIWSKSRNCYVVASELAKGHTKASSTGDKTRRLALAAITALMLLPVGGFSYAADATSTALHISSSGNLIIGTNEKHTVRDMEIRGKLTSGSISTGRITATDDATVKGKLEAEAVYDDTTKTGNYVVQAHTVGANLGVLDTQVKANADAIAKKANQTDLDAINTEVAKKANQTDLDETNDNLAKKAEQTALDETNAEVAKKADAANVYTKAETDLALSAKANAADVYTKAETDQKVDAANTYTYRKVAAEEKARAAADAALDDKITAETSARVAADTKLVEAVNSGLSLSNDNVLQKNTTTIDAQGNVTTSKTDANEMILKGRDNQITLNEKGIKVGTNSTVVDKDGVYTGGDDYTAAKAALKSDGSIKGADGKFTVDGTNGNVNTNGSLTATSGKIGNVSMSADGTMTGVKDLTASGKITADSFTDGTATMSNGSLNSVNQINATGNIVTTGNMKAHDITAEGTIKGETINGTTGTFGSLSTTGNASVGGTLTTNGITNTGNTTTDTLAVNHNATVGGNLGVTGDITGKSLNVGTGSISGGQITGTGLDVGAGTIKTTGATETGTLKTTGKAEIGGDLSVAGNTEMKGNLDVKGDLSVEGEFNANTLSSKLDKNNYTEIHGGNVTSVNSKVDTTDGKTYTSTSTLTEKGKTETASNGINRNVNKMDATESSNVITNDANGKTSTFEQRVDEILNQINSSDTVFSKVDQQVNNITSEVTDGTNTTSSTQTIKDITNTAEQGTITNNAKNLSNSASESITNTAGNSITNTATNGDITNNALNGTLANNAKNIANTTTENMTNVVGGNLTNTVTGNMTSSAKNISNTATEALTNTAKDITNNASNNITNIAAETLTNQGKNVATIASETASTNAKNITNTASENITNTASNGTITNEAKDLVNHATEDMTNTVDRNLTTTVGNDMTTTVTGKTTENYNGGLETTITGEEKHTVNGDQTNTITGKQTTTVTGDSSLTAENITNEAKNKITNKAIDVETDATSSIVNKVANDYGSNTSTQLSYQTKEEMSQVDGKKASYLRGAAEEKSQLTDGDKKTTIDTIAGQTNTNITDGTNTSNSLQKADQVASSVTDGTNTTVVNQDATSLASSITDGTKANNTNNTVDKSEQLIKASDTQYSATTKTATKTEDALVSGSSVIDVIKSLDDAANPLISSTVTDGTNTTGVTQTAKDITNTAKNGTIANDAQNITNKASETLSNNAKNITNTATEKLSNSATDIENKAFNSILNQVGDNTSWKMTDGQVVESIKGTDGQTNTTTTTANDTYQSVQNGNNVLAKRTSSTNDNLNITDGTNTYTKITTATSNKQTVTDGTETASTNLTKSASNTYITNGTQTVTNHIAADTTNTVMNEGSNGSRQEQTASQILNRVTDGTYTSEVKQTASEVATSAKDITNTASEKITNQIGDGSAVKSEMTADGITNTAEGGTIYNKSKDILNEASGDILNFADGEIGNVATKITNITGNNTVTSDTNGTTFENTANSTAIKEGTVTKTTISGNTLETGQATMDYADVMKDLGVRGSTTLGTTANDKLTVNATSTFNENVSMKKDLSVGGTTTTDKLVVNNGATVTGGTTTDTLKVTGSSEFGGKATFNDNVKMNKGLSVTGGVTADTVTADYYKVGDNTYIDSNGINANNKKVAHVAPGRIAADSTDAVNGSQLYQTNERVTGVENKVNKLDSRVDKVGANAAALANLHPLEFDADSKWNIAAAVGGYKGETATAIGAFYRPNENVMINVSSSFGTGENMYGGGISLRIGQGGNKARRNATNGLTDREKAMQKQIDSLTNRLDALLSVINPNMSKDFPDVPENHWAYEAVSRLAGNGVIQGYEDGKYHGERTMTRYEMAEIIYNALSKGAKAEKKLVEEFKPELQAMAAQKKA